PNPSARPAPSLWASCPPRCDLPFATRAGDAMRKQPATPCAAPMPTTPSSRGSCELPRDNGCTKRKARRRIMGRALPRCSLPTAWASPPAYGSTAGHATAASRPPHPMDEAPGFEAIASHRHPLWLIDSHRRVHLRNAAAEALRERADRLVEVDGRLHCTDPLDDTELACALVRLEL